MKRHVAYANDLVEESPRERRRINSAGRWLPLAAGATLIAYGLASRRRPGWLLAGLGGLLVEFGATGRCQLYETISKAAGRDGSDTRRALGGSRGVNVEESVTIDRSIEALYTFWRNLENLPRFMHHLESVERMTDTLSRWRALGPGKTRVEWTAEIINDVPNKVIAWRSIEGSDVASAGSVTFTDAGPGRGTRVRVRLQYSPPGGKIGAAAARLFGRDAGTEIREDLRKFKQILEAGEVATTEGQPHG